MSKELHIARNLKLPADTVTSTLVIYGGKGMGKTNLASVLVEELHATGARFCAIDPMGVWWGLRHSADGKGAGIELLILGGRHGDMPIEPAGGKVVADLVVDEDISVLIDISRHADGRSWSKGEKIRFVKDYITRLFERQGERSRPIMQIIDEAARFVPQNPRKGDEDVAACMGAIEQMVEEGRNIGIGTTLIAQRSARLNKSVAELADCMIAFRTVGPNSVASILDWFGEHVPKERWNELVEKLRALPRGVALVVSPGWLGYEGVAEIRLRHTFDSSATPKAGQERRAKGKGAMPDLARYRELMAETIEKAEASDPRKLQQKLASLKEGIAHAYQLASAYGAPQEVLDNYSALLQGKAPHKFKAVAPLERSKEVSTERLQKEFEEGALAERKKIGAEIGKALGSVRRTLSSLLPLMVKVQTPNEGFERVVGGEALAELDKATAILAKTAPMPEPEKVAVSRPPNLQPAPRSTALRQPAAPSDGTLSAPERRILTVLAQRPHGVDLDRLAILGGYTVNGHFNNVLGGLRGKSLVTPARVIPIQITEEGIASLGDYEPLPTGEELQRWWLQRLTAPEAKILSVLLKRYPEEISLDGLAAEAGYTVNGHFNNVIGSLRTKGLMTPPRAPIRAAEDFFV